MLKIISILVCSFVLTAPAFGQNFFFKQTPDANEKPSVAQLDFKILENSAIEFETTKDLEMFIGKNEKLPTEKIEKRAPTAAENAVNVGLWIMTGLIVMSIHDMYQITESLKLSSHRGLMFFIFPFEKNYLYRTCKGQDILVATTMSPSGESWNRVKSLAEVKELCDSEENEPQQPSDNPEQSS